MTLYLDSSALLKRYIEDPDSSQFTTILSSDEGWLTCRIADLTGSRSLDAVHLAAMQRAGPSGITLVTADLRQAQAARSLGWPVLGT